MNPTKFETFVNWPFFPAFWPIICQIKTNYSYFLALTCKTRRVRFPWNVLDAKHFSWRSSKLWKLRSLLSIPVSSTVVLNNYSQIVYSLKSHFRFWLPETHFSVLYPYFFRYKFIFHDYLVLFTGLIMWFGHRYSGQFTLSIGHRKEICVLAFESLFGGQFTLSTQLIKPNYNTPHGHSTAVSLYSYLSWLVGLRKLNNTPCCVLCSSVVHNFMGNVKSVSFFESYVFTLCFLWSKFCQRRF